MKKIGTSPSSMKTADSATHFERAARALAAAEARAIRLRGAAIAFRTALMWRREGLTLREQSH